MGRGRDLYESVDTVVDEVSFFKGLRSHPDYKRYSFFKLPMSYEVDCAISQSGSVVGFCEFKRRKVIKDCYDTLILSLKKYKALASYSSNEVQSKLFVRWNDVSSVHEVSPGGINYRIAWGGRSDRGDWQDSEPVVHIPVEDFEDLNIDIKPLDNSEHDRLVCLLDKGKSWKVGSSI